MLFSDQANFLIDVGKMRCGDRMVIKHRGTLTWESVKEALVSQYGAGVFEVVQHGSAMYINKEDPRT